MYLDMGNVRYRGVEIKRTERYIHAGHPTFWRVDVEMYPISTKPVLKPKVIDYRFKTLRLAKQFVDEFYTLLHEEAL